MRWAVAAALFVGACSSPADEAEAEMAQAMRSQTDMVQREVGLAEIFGDCTQDCSGHRAGYLWALEHEQVFEDDCDPAAGHSFHHGCRMGARAAAFE